MMSLNFTLSIWSSSLFYQLSGWPSGLRRCVQVAVWFSRRGFESHFWQMAFIVSAFSKWIFKLWCHTLKLATKTVLGSGGIRTHASEETGALNQRLRPLGHATLLLLNQWYNYLTDGHSICYIHAFIALVWPLFCIGSQWGKPPKQAQGMVSIHWWDSVHSS